MKHILHQGKRDRIIFEDGENLTPEQTEGEKIRDWIHAQDSNMRQLAARLEISGARLSDAVNGHLSLQEICEIHQRILNL